MEKIEPALASERERLRVRNLEDVLEAARWALHCDILAGQEDNDFGPFHQDREKAMGALAMAVRRAMLKQSAQTEKGGK